MVKNKISDDDLKTVYPVEVPNSELAENLLKWLESLPHAQRLYPDLFCNDLADKIETFYRNKS